ncbi:MAG: hypothetical protein ACRCTL_07850 [Pseudomonas sp.]
MQLGFCAPQQVLDVIATMGRTEDLRFSPDRRRFAIAAMQRQKIFIFAVEVQRTATGKLIQLNTAVELSAEELQSPHGLDFIDNDTLAVANRNGDLTLFRLPPHNDAATAELTLLQCFPNQDRTLQRPSSVAIAHLGTQQHELLVCREAGSCISRHVIDVENAYSLTEEQVLLDKWLKSPNGISLSQRWLAVSSLNTQSVLLYPHGPQPCSEALPQAVLRGAYAPHGIRFSDDERYLLLADAGSPYVHIYCQPDAHWQGVYDPCLSLRVMSDALFQVRNATPPLKGGPKGIDIDWTNGILVTTCQTQPLAFFDLDHALAAVRRQGPLDTVDGSASAPQSTLDVRHELDRQQLHAQNAATARLSVQQIAQARHRTTEVEQRALTAEARALHAEALLADAQARATCAESRVQALLASHSWQITAPLRRVLSLRKRKD